MRAVMFWSWMRILFMTKVGYVVWPLLMLEVPKWAGVLSYNLKLTLYAIDLTAIVVGFTILVCLGVSYIIKKFARTKTSDKMAKFIFDKADATSSFCGLVHSYFRSAHDRVCPEITFLDLNNNNKEK